MPLGDFIKKQRRNIHRCALFKKKTCNRVSDKGIKKPEVVEKQLLQVVMLLYIYYIALSIASTSGNLQIDPNNFSDSFTRNTIDITVVNSDYTDVFRDISSYIPTPTMEVFANTTLKQNWCC